MTSKAMQAITQGGDEPTVSLLDSVQQSAPARGQSYDRGIEVGSGGDMESNGFSLIVLINDLNLPARFSTLFYIFSRCARNDSWRRGYSTYRVTISPSPDSRA
jgi:hypothetical protein